MPDPTTSLALQAFVCLHLWCRTELLCLARWPLSGIPGLQSRVGRDTGGFLGGDGSGGVPCAAGCERWGNCNRDSGTCE